MTRAGAGYAAILAVFCAIGLTACSAEFSVGGDSLDTDQAEQVITDGLAKAYGDPPEDVSCPAGVNAERGETFTCTGTSPDGRGFSLLVTVTSDDGDISYPLEVDWDDEEPGDGSGSGATEQAPTS